MLEFQGYQYFDDRLFILYLCEASVEFSTNMVTATIYHEGVPAKSEWCLITYRNCSRYPVYNIRFFNSKQQASDYIRKIEPTTPRVSLNGKSPTNPLSYEEFLFWKKSNNLREYNYREMYSAGGSNPKEVIIQTFEQFLSSSPEYVVPPVEAKKRRVC